jgi:hypothetical protein
MNAAPMRKPAAGPRATMLYRMPGVERGMGIRGGSFLILNPIS